MSLTLEVPSFVRQASSQPPPPVQTMISPAEHSQRRESGKQIRRWIPTLAGCAVVYMFVSSGLPPYVEAHRLNAEAARLQQRIKVAREKQDTLQRQIAMLNTNQGKQNAARAYGWVLKGEIAIACPRPDTELSRTSDAELLAPPPAASPSLLERVQQAMPW